MLLPIKLLIALFIANRNSHAHRYGRQFGPSQGQQLIEQFYGNQQFPQQYPNGAQNSYPYSDASAVGGGSNFNPIPSAWTASLMGNSNHDPGFTVDGAPMNPAASAVGIQSGPNPGLAASAIGMPNRSPYRPSLAASAVGLNDDTQYSNTEYNAGFAASTHGTPYDSRDYTPGIASSAIGSSSDNNPGLAASAIGTPSSSSPYRPAHGVSSPLNPEYEHRLAESAAAQISRHSDYIASPAQSHTPHVKNDFSSSVANDETYKVHSAHYPASSQSQSQHEAKQRRETERNIDYVLGHLTDVSKHSLDSHESSEERNSSEEDSFEKKRKRPFLTPAPATFPAERPINIDSHKQNKHTYSDTSIIGHNGIEQKSYPALTNNGSMSKFQVNQINVSNSSNASRWPFTEHNSIHSTNFPHFSSHSYRPSAVTADETPAAAPTVTVEPMTSASPTLTSASQYDFVIASSRYPEKNYDSGNNRHGEDRAGHDDDSSPILYIDSNGIFQLHRSLNNRRQQQHQHRQQTEIELNNSGVTTSNRNSSLINETKIDETAIIFNDNEQMRLNNRVAHVSNNDGIINEATNHFAAHERDDGHRKHVQPNLYNGLPVIP